MPLAHESTLRPGQERAHVRISLVTHPTVKVALHAYSCGVVAPRVPSDEGDGPVRLVGDQGFSAEIDRERWLLVGGPASVSRTVSRKNVGPWNGTVAGFRRAWAMVTEWKLASGELRHASMIVPLSEGWPVGHQHPIRMGAHSWTATVARADEAIEVAIRFTIQSGAIRRRAFYVLGHLDYFGTLVNGGVNVEVLQLAPSKLPR